MVCHFLVSFGALWCYALNMDIDKEIDMAQRWLQVILAVEAQANDETLWGFNVMVNGELERFENKAPSKKPAVGIGEAYVQQSLRWLHQVIESGDLKALQSIIDQSKGLV